MQTKEDRTIGIIHNGIYGLGLSGFLKGKRGKKVEDLITITEGEIITSVDDLSIRYVNIRENNNARAIAEVTIYRKKFPLEPRSIRRLFSPRPRYHPGTLLIVSDNFATLCNLMGYLFSQINLLEAKNLNTREKKALRQELIDLVGRHFK